MAVRQNSKYLHPYSEKFSSPFHICIQFRKMIEIRPILDSDWERIKTIFEEGIETGLATFETKAPDWKTWNSDHLSECRLLAHEGAEILGWAALSQVSDRCVYGGVAEVSVYVSSSRRGLGVGHGLLNSLAFCSESNGYWTLQSGIFSENHASIRLHEKAGFRIIGFRERIGKIKGQWMDNILMERRSNKIGVD